MKNRMIITTVLCVALSTLSYAEDKAVGVAKKETPAPAVKKEIPAAAVKKEAPKKAENLSAADVIGDSNVKVDAAIGFVESFSIMGECAEGQKARQDIETKRDLATKELQEESKKFEKSKADYVAKSTTMSDSAREKEEKKLMKMERDLKSLVTEKEEELKLDMQIATETLAQGLEAGVAQLAKNENLDIVFDKMTGRAIYVSEKFDYSSEALKEMNKNYEIKLAQNKVAAEPAVKVAENKAATPAAKPAKVGA